MTQDNSIFSDDDIVRSVRDGNTRNYEILVNRYKNKIINFIHKMIFDYDEAQSLTQDTFLKIYETIPKYKTQNNFQAFIFTIAKNLTLNHIKKQKRIRFFSGFQPNNTEDNIFRTEETQYAAMEKIQQEQIMTTALKNLNENQRIALVLKIYLDFPYKRIADITGWSIPKIETLISRAKSNLKNQIKSTPNREPQEKMQENKRKNVLQVRAI